MAGSKRTGETEEAAVWYFAGKFVLDDVNIDRRDVASGYIEADARRLALINPDGSGPYFKIRNQTGTSSSVTSTRGAFPAALCSDALTRLSGDNASCGYQERSL